MSILTSIHHKTTGQQLTNVYYFIWLLGEGIVHESRKASWQSTEHRTKEMSQ